MLPVTAGVVVVRIRNWKARKPGGVSVLIPACYYTLMIIGVAIWGYFQAVGAAILAVALIGMLKGSLVGVVALTGRRRILGPRWNARGDGGTAEPGPLEVRRWGRSRAVVGGRAVEMRAAKVRAHLAVLTLHPDQVLSADGLAEGPWGSHHPPGLRVLAALAPGPGGRS